jgi:DNA replication and repair protein RecF
MSELDPERRERLAARIVRHGQSVVTTTDLAHVPGAGAAGVARVAVADGTLDQEAIGTAEAPAGAAPVQSGAAATDPGVAPEARAA